MNEKRKVFGGKPDWLKTQFPGQKKYIDVKKLVEEKKLHTICTSGNCPNIGECWAAGTSTLMILGDICTRACKFCNVKTGRPLAVDTEEPLRVAESVKTMKLKHVVITSVDRDDLPDYGAGIWAETIFQVKKLNPKTTIEVLIPDFNGNEDCINEVIEAGPEVISHNLETVERLTKQVRNKARYAVSLKVLKYLSDNGIRTKSGIMLGLGETPKEVFKTIDDLKEAGCHVVTIGQYLRPSAKHMEVQEYIHPDQFEKYKEYGLKIGFDIVESSPLVRSSYRAERHV